MGIKSTQKYLRERFGGEFVSGKYEGYHTEQFGDASAEGPATAGLTATGGIISEYADPTGQKWVAHTFTAPGNFDITAKGSYPLAVDYFLVAGGGGGGGGHGGGGGAGGVETGTDLPVDIAT